MTILQDATNEQMGTRNKQGCGRDVLLQNFVRHMDEYKKKLWISQPFESLFDKIRFPHSGKVLVVAKN